MNDSDARSDYDLSEATEEEYGGGSELSTTGFLVFGLLTFWIYTVWEYHKILCSHFKLRSRHFTESLHQVSLP